jgi:hypothetical protein
VDTQATLGALLILVGLLSWFDRRRPLEDRRRYFWYDPSFGLRGRTLSAIVLLVVGAGLIAIG